MPADTASRRPRGRPPRTEDQRAVHRTRLIEAAMEAVRQVGPDVSMDQVADMAEVSKPVLYSEFGDKVGLVDAIAVTLAEGVENTVRERLAAEHRFDLDAVIEAIIEALVDLIDAEPLLYSYIVRSIRMRDRGLLDNALVRVVHDRVAFIITSMMSEMAGEDLDILTAGVFGFVFSVVELWMETRRPDKARLVATITAVIRGGLTDAVELRAQQETA